MSKTLLRNVTKRYGSDFALREFSYDFPEKGLVALLGPSGSGKSTLLGVLSGMDIQYEGAALVLNHSMKGFNQEQRTEFRMKNIGYVFQSFNLLELETAFDNVYFPIDATSVSAKKYKTARALELLRYVGLDEKANSKVNCLSGGEKQRVAFARALACSPKILLCDEPTANLDEKNSTLVFEIIKSYAKNHLAVVVTHDEALARDHADTILRIEDGRLISEESNRPLPNRKVLGLPPIQDEAEKSKLSTSFVVRHSTHLIKSKRIRSILSRASLSLGLTGLGLSLYVGTSISSEISRAFDAIVPENQIIVEQRNKPESIINGIKASTGEKMEYVCRKYEEAVDWGTSVFMNYEQMFTDDDSFTVLTAHRSFLLANFRMRHINEFRWLEDMQDKVLPHRPKHMENDEVVLGLPFQNMAALCFNLGIERNYLSLGNYLSSNTLRLLQFASNSSIEFYNEDLYTVVGICKSDAPTFYHLNHRWNHDIIVEHLNFRSTSSLNGENVQQVPEIPYIQIRGEPGELMRKIRNDKATENLLFEQSSDLYLPSQCTPFSPCSIARLYAYEGKRSGIAKIDTGPLYEDKRIIGSAFSSEGGYFATATSFLQGFSGRAFLSNDEAALFEATETTSSVRKEYANKMIDLPEGVFDGSIYGSAKKFQFSGNYAPLVSGKPPKGPDEVVLSSSFWEKLGRPESVFLACAVSEEEVGGMVIREFRSAKLQVTGVKKSHKDELCADENWTFDFFADRLGVSSFRLEPTALMFYFSSDGDATSFMEEQQKAFPDLLFYSPRAEVKDSISGVAGYVGGVLGLFSVISLMMSCLLFSLTMSVTIGENKNEAHLLYALGVSWGDIARIYRAIGFQYGLVCLAGSSVTILLSAVVVGRFVSSSFAAPFSFSFPLIPFLATLGFVVSFLLVMDAIVKKRIQRQYGNQSKNA